MSANRILDTNEAGALGALRVFLSDWWDQAEIKAMLAPVELPDRQEVVTKVIESPSDLAFVNPFAPIMRANATAEVAEFVGDGPQGRLMALLRPCELRTLIELQKRNRIPSRPSGGGEAPERLITMVVDCPGTLPPADFAERVERHGLEEVTQEALGWAAKGSFKPALLRAACQVCDWPAARDADVTIGTFGVTPDRYLLVLAGSEETTSKLGLERVTDGEAAERKVARRQGRLSRVEEKRVERRKALTTARSWREGELFGLLGSFARCTLCADCLDACPLYDGELTSMLGVGGARRWGRPILPELVSLSRWLASCSGCGMCEEACPFGLPLATLVLAISHRVRAELQYTPGDLEQSLPWSSE
jgi:formate dehydrogenase subunit beta